MSLRPAILILLLAPAMSNVSPGEVDFAKLRAHVVGSAVFKEKVSEMCKNAGEMDACQEQVSTKLICQLLRRKRPELALAHCSGPSNKAPKAAPVEEQSVALSSGMQRSTETLQTIKARIENTDAFKNETLHMSQVLGCNGVRKVQNCDDYVNEAAFCLALAGQLERFAHVQGIEKEKLYCEHIDEKMPQLSLLLQGKFVSKPSRPARASRFLQVSDETTVAAPEDDLAQEMTHDLEMNFNKIAPFGKEDTAKELQDHAAKTQDTLVDAVENAEVAEIKRAVFRALTRLRAATIKEFDTIARLETQAIDAYNDAHHYRAENPLAHLHEDEAPVETDKLKSFH